MYSLKFNKTDDITDLIWSELNERTLDLSIDYAEIGLDAFLTDGLLKEIPIVQSIVSFYKISQSLTNRHNTKKILTFFQEFHKSKIDPDKLKKFKENLNRGSKYREQVLETIILLNERFLQIEKSKILARLLIAHVEERLSWDDFTNLSIILDTIHPLGFWFLNKMSEESDFCYHGRDEIGEALMFACGIGHRHGTRFGINNLGQKFFEFGIK